MERVMATLQSTGSPLCFISNNAFTHNHNHKHSLWSSISVKTRKSISRKVSETLSSNWDVSNSSSLTPTLSRFPRLDELDTTNMLLRQRIVFLSSQLDDLSADFIISQLLLLDAEDNEKDIKLFINSPGGSVTAGMGIYDAIKMCRADVSTICMGLAASMGAFILAAGTKGKRYCMPNARIMLHQPRGNTGENSIDYLIRVRELNLHRAKMQKILSRITGKSEKQIDKDTKHDYFISAWDAKEYGLVDEVIDDGKAGHVAPLPDYTPPAQVMWDIWDNDRGDWDAMRNLPSEHKLLDNGYAGIQKV